MSTRLRSRSGDLEVVSLASLPPADPNRNCRIDQGRCRRRLMARLPFSRPRSTLASTTGERWYEPELLRFKAEMLLIQPKQRAIEAEQCLKAAIALAQQQEAKFWELRATATLAKLRADQGRPSEAHDLLAPVYGCFTEGFDTLDLKQAKALLDGLHA